jgi:hypothetical protein
MNARALFALVLLSLTGAAFAHHTPHHERVETLAMVKRLGGTVTKVEKTVTKIDLHKTAVTDSDVAMLLSIGELQELDLRQTSVTDEGIAPLHDLKQLRVLRVGESRVTAAGSARLKKALPQLKIE